MTFVRVSRSAQPRLLRGDVGGLQAVLLLQAEVLTHSSALTELSGAGSPSPVPPHKETIRRQASRQRAWS